MERLFLCFCSSAGLWIFLIFHRLVALAEGKGFFSLRGWLSEYILWGSSLYKKILLLVAVSSSSAVSFFLFKSLLKNLEKRWLKSDGDVIRVIGYRAVWAGIAYSILLCLFGTAFVAIDVSLINVWDFFFVVVLIGMVYVGVFLHFYYAVPLDRWKADDPAVELEKLKIEYDDLRLCFRYFVWSVVVILGGQVFVALRLKFEPFYKDPYKYQEIIETLRPVMALNALQVAFLILVAWSTVLSRFLRRMEEVKFQLKELKLPNREVKN